jgi:sarcosine oxidase subunit beta
MSGQPPATHRLWSLERPPASADLIVIGGGVVGAATAFFAGQAGLSTVLVERRPALATLTTPASTGAFRLQFDNPEEIALVREGVELFTNFAERTGLAGFDIGLCRPGYLFCTTSPAGLARQRQWVTAQQAWGLTDVELLTGDEARYRFPYLAPTVLQARYRAGDGFLDPVRLCYGYALASAAHLCLATTVTGFQRQGERITGVLTDRGPIAAAAVVIAAGPFSATLAALADLTVDLRPTRRQKLVIPELPVVPPTAPMTIDEETAAHWRPALHGAYALWTEPGTPAGRPLDDVPTSADFAFGLLDPASPRALARISPFWGELWPQGLPAWFLQAGQYEYTPDHRPYLGPSPLAGLHFNFGYSGHGVMASPGGSRLVIDLLLGRRSADDNPFRPDRPIVERPLDIL